MSQEVFKNPNAQAIDLEKKSINITDELNKATEKVPFKDGEDYEDYEGRIWSEISNHYHNMLSPEAMTEIASKRAKELWNNRKKVAQAESMLPDELEMFIDELYDERLPYGEAEYDLDDDRHAYFEKAPFGSGSDFNVTITKGDDILDEWGDWYPIKKARNDAKASLIKRLRGIK